MAGRKRHAKAAQLKQEFINYYESGKFQSMAKAAEKFLQSLDDEKSKILTTSNAERTLLGALRAHRRASKRIQ